MSLWLLTSNSCSMSLFRPNVSSWWTTVPIYFKVGSWVNKLWFQSIYFFYLIYCLPAEFPAVVDCVGCVVIVICCIVVVVVDSVVVDAVIACVSPERIHIVN